MINCLSRGVPSTTRPPLQDGLVHEKCPCDQGLSASAGDKVWGERMFSFLRLRNSHVREHATNVGTNLAQRCSSHVR